MKFKTLIAPIIALVTSTGTTHGIMTPYQELEERNTLIASIDEDTPLYFDQAGAAKDSKCSQQFPQFAQFPPFGLVRITKK